MIQSIAAAIAIPVILIAMLRKPEAAAEKPVAAEVAPAEPSAKKKTAGPDESPAVTDKQLHKATDALTMVADVFDALDSPKDAHACQVLRGRLWHRPDGEVVLSAKQAEISVDP